MVTLPREIRQTQASRHSGITTDHLDEPAASWEAAETPTAPLFGVERRNRWPGHRGLVAGE